MVIDGEKEIELHEYSMKRYVAGERQSQERLRNKPPKYLRGIDQDFATALRVPWGLAIDNHSIRLAFVPVPLKPSPLKRLM